MLLLKNIGVFL